MDEISTTRNAHAAAVALGYQGFTAIEYRAFCAEMRRESGIDFAARRPSWLDLSPRERTTVLVNLRRTYPGARDPVSLVACFRRMLSAYKGEAGRIPRCVNPIC
jgi:hypothetical protein